MPPRKKVAPKKKRAPASRFIILHNIDVERILNQYYGENDETNSEEIEETPINFNENIDISSLMHEKDKKSKRSIYFIDPNKEKVKMWVNMVDIVQAGALPRFTNEYCWWCRSSFTTHPIGCPLRYHSENLPPLKKKRAIKRLLDANLPVDDGIDFFETEGIFCTFPCVKAYIIDNLSKSDNNDYRRSLTLLTFMYQKLMGEKQMIPAAGSWKTLINYGGHLTPEEFRSASGLLEYTVTPNARRPLMYSSGFYIREKRLKL